MRDRSRLLFHPIFLISLAILIVNDHYLKAACPCWLTGKLSDFAGLMTVAVALSVLMRPWTTSAKQLAALHLWIAATFAVWKLMPVEVPLQAAAKLLSLPQPSKTPDPTDLVALPVLFASYRFITSARWQERSGSLVMKMAQTGVLAITGLATMATTLAPVTYINRASESYTLRLSPAEYLWRIETALREQKVMVKDRQEYSGGRYALAITCSLPFDQKTGLDPIDFRGNVYFTLQLTSARLDSISLFGARGGSKEVWQRMQIAAERNIRAPLNKALRQP